MVEYATREDAWHSVDLALSTLGKCLQNGTLDWKHIKGKAK